MSEEYANEAAQAEGSEKAKRKLAADMRFRIRRLQHVAPFSQEWVDQIDSLKYLSSIATTESSDHAVALPAAPVQMKGENGVALQGTSSESSTIWERDEVCVRIVVEEGKFNLLMREMVEYKAAVYGSGFPAPEFESYGKLYETSLGLLVKAGLTAIECLQTLDVRALLDHTAVVLSHALAPAFVPLASDRNIQELQVIAYLDLIFRQVEKLQVDVIVEKFVDLGLFELVLKHFEKFCKVFDDTYVSGYLYFLANLFDTEFYRSKITVFFPTKDDKKRFAQLMESTTKSYVAGHADAKKPLRPLSDAILRFK
jgi:hypothetical protein